MSQLVISIPGGETIHKHPITCKRPINIGGTIRVDIEKMMKEMPNDEFESLHAFVQKYPSLMVKNYKVTAFNRETGHYHIEPVFIDLLESLTKRVRAS